MTSPVSVSTMAAVSPAPVHLHDLTGLVIQVHGGVGLGQIVGVILVELGGLVRDLARRPALVAVLEPEQIQGDTAALELLVYVSIVRHLVDGLRGTGWEQPLRELLVRHFSGSGHCRLQFATRYSVEATVFRAH